MKAQNRTAQIKKESERSESERRKKQIDSADLPFPDRRKKAEQSLEKTADATACG